MRLVNKLESLMPRVNNLPRQERATYDSLNVEPRTTPGVKLGRVRREMEGLDDQERIERNGGCRLVSM